MKVQYQIRHILPLVLVIASLAFGTFLQPVFAQSSQEPTGFKNVTLWVNPEYDDPRLLVMLEGQITGVTAPSLVRFLVPEKAEMFSAGTKDAQGRYSGGPPNRKASSVPGWDEISYELKYETFRVEYYDPIITGQPDKKIAYEFRWLYPISDLGVVIQQPLKATDFKVSPEGALTRDGEGFNVQSYTYNNLRPTDPPLRFDIAYTKTDPDPSISNPQLQSGTAGRTNLTPVLWSMVAIVVVGGIVWVLKSRKKTAYARAAVRRSKQARSARGKRPRTRYCRQCGQAIEETDLFCSRCGTGLR
ncbi:MAG: zinc ribbon domain-containing protein [Chloroflexi bacterium]|nr:zinc ribbon domain-containing protein [Chloroflexota bacterium]